MDRITSLAHFITAGALCIGGLLLGAAPALAQGPASRAATCEPPVLIATIDPASSAPMSPHLDIHWEGISTPGQARIDRGDGEYDMAAITYGHGPAAPLLLDPTYASAGTYHLTATVTDACGLVSTGALDITVPLALPRMGPTVMCPGVTDESGYCVVQPGELQLRVAGARGADAWHWTIHPTRAAEAPGRDGLPSVHIEAGAHHMVQATTVTEDGWLVTPAMHLVAVTARPPAITEIIVPGPVAADSPVWLGFTVPAGGDLAQPSITIDDRLPIDAAAAEVRFGAGAHTVTYALRFPDGSVVQRQVMVVAAAPLPVVQALAVVIGALGVVGIVAIGRRRRSWRAAPDRSPVASSARMVSEMTFDSPSIAPVTARVASVPTTAVAFASRIGRHPTSSARIAGLAVAMCVGIVAIGTHLMRPSHR